MSYRSFKSALLISAFALSAAPAFAAEDDPIVVVANRLQISASDTPSAVTVITAEEIADRQITSVFEALRGTPGVSLTQNGGVGQPATVRIRGANDDQTLVLVDGVPVNDPSGLVGYDFAFLDAGGVERIEVLRGAGSAIWGSDAIGGVVNIVTFVPGKNGGSVYAEGGSLNTGRMGARGAVTFGPLTLASYANAMKTSGISAADEDNGNTEEDGSENTTVGVRAVYAITDALSLQGGFRATDGFVEFDDDFGSGAIDGASFSDSRETLADARLTWRTDRFGAEGAVSRSLTKRSYSFGGFPAHYRGERTLMRLSGDVEIVDGHVLLAGLEQESIESEGDFSAGDSDSTAQFLVYRGHFGERVLLEASVRHEEDDRYGDSTTPRLGASVKAWSGGVLKANWGKGYKAPTVDEVTGGGFTGPNSNLQPEESEEWDAGVEQTLLDGAVKLTAIYFDRDVENLIVYGSPSYTNAPGVTNFKGLETSAEAVFGPVKLDFAYTYSDTEAARIPENQFSLDASWQATDRLTLGGLVLWNDEEKDNLSGTRINDAWTRLDLRAGFALLEAVEVYGRVQNVTDENYQDTWSFGTPGRTAYGGVRVKF